MNAKKKKRLKRMIKISIEGHLKGEKGTVLAWPVIDYSFKLLFQTG